MLVVFVISIIKPIFGIVPVWKTLSSTVEEATLTQQSGFSIIGRRFQIGNGQPYVPGQTHLGPGSHGSKYGQPKKFFAVDRSDGLEGVVWQEEKNGIRPVHMTWIAADMLSASTKRIVESKDHLVAVASNGMNEVVLIMVSPDIPADKTQPTQARAIKVHSSTGAILRNKQLNTAKGGNGLNIHKFFASGGSMVWDKATNSLGLIISRLMTRGGDGLTHQSAIFVVFDAATLNVRKNFGQTSSHSWANSITLASDGKFLGMDLGDNFPRGVHVWKFGDTQRLASKLVYAFKAQHATKPSWGGPTFPRYDDISTPQRTYYKWSNDNNVYTEIAHPGLVEVSDGVLVFFCGERPPLDNSKVGSNMNVPRNMGVVKISKDLKQVVSGGETSTGGFYNFGGGWSPQQNKGIRFLTNYESMDESVSRPKTARLMSGRNLLIWEIWTTRQYVKTQAMVVDDNGNVVQPLLTSGYPMTLPFCDDLRVKGGRAIAYAGEPNSGKLIRYEICAGTSCASGTGGPGGATTRRRRRRRVRTRRRRRITRRRRRRRRRRRVATKRKTTLVENVSFKTKLTKQRHFMRRVVSISPRGESHQYFQRLRNNVIRREASVVSPRGEIHPHFQQ